MECLAWLRPDEDAEARINAVLDPDGQNPATHAAGVADFLATRNVARADVDGAALIVDVNDPNTLAWLDVHVAVQTLIVSGEGIDHIGVAHGAERPHLNQATILSASAFGRRVTQHCSLAVWDADYEGVRYRSQHDIVEGCWAVFDHVPVVFDAAVPLSPQDPAHRDAIESVAAMWTIPLGEWS